MAYIPKAHIKELIDKNISLSKQLVISNHAEGRNIKARPKPALLALLDSLDEVRTESKDSEEENSDESFFIAPRFFVKNPKN